MIEKFTMMAMALALTAGAVGEAAVSSADTPATSALGWGACLGGGGVDGMECATLNVPLDWTNPAGRQVTLTLGRLRADGPTPAEGSVLVNYGGPGVPGVDAMRDRTLSPGSQPFAALRQKMNIVTWNPRGYQALVDSSCLSKGPARRQPDLPRSQAEFDQLAATNRATADVCRNQDPDLFDHMDSLTNAHDMEAIRQALGERQLNLYMGSYGSVYGETYAGTYPDRVRTMVIDGGGDHTTEFGRAQAALARDNAVRMARFTGWCASDASCALHGLDVPALWQNLVAKADRAPIPAPSAHVQFTGWTLRELASGRLIRGDSSDWGKLAQDIKAADAGDASGFAQSPQHPYPAIGYPVAECRDWPRPTSFQQLTATVARLDRVDENMGAAGTIVASSLACVGWPASLDNPPRPLPATLPPLLGVGTWTDYPATSRVVGQVPGSASVYHDGYGHELYASGNACVIARVDTYFTDRVLPTAGTEC